MARTDQTNDKHGIKEPYYIGITPQKKITEGKDKVAVYDKENNETIHIPKDVKCLRATLKSTKEKWNLTEKEGVVMVYVIHKGELEIKKML
jgi:hypothetical protein